jgi:hypothetical protein
MSLFLPYKAVLTNFNNNLVSFEYLPRVLKLKLIRVELDQENSKIEEKNTRLTLDALGVVIAIVDGLLHALSLNRKTIWLLKTAPCIHVLKSTAVASLVLYYETGFN